MLERNLEIKTSTKKAAIITKIIETDFRFKNLFLAKNTPVIIVTNNVIATAVRRVNGIIRRNINKNNFARLYFSYSNFNVV